MDALLEKAVIHPENFAYRDLIGVDKWPAFTVVFGSLTVVGATSYSGLYRIVGAECRFQVQFSAATSIASVAGTSYLNLPMTAKGISGQVDMVDKTSNLWIGGCVIAVANSRCYLPTQVASANVFLLAGWFQI